jgi:hypothetical protein
LRQQDIQDAAQAVEAIAAASQLTTQLQGLNLPSI